MEQNGARRYDAALLRRLRTGETLLVAHPDDNVEPWAIRNAADRLVSRLSAIEVHCAVSLMMMSLVIVNVVAPSGTHALLAYAACVVVPPVVFCGLAPWGGRVVARDVLTSVDFAKAKEINFSYEDFQWEVGHFNGSWGRESKARAAYMRRAWTLAERVEDGSWVRAEVPVSSCQLPKPTQ